MIAAINFGTYDPFFKTLIAPMFGVSPDSLTWWHQTAFIAFITLSQAILNARGIKIASKITDLSGYLIFVVTIALVVSLLVYSPIAFDLHRLVTFTNFTGVDGGAWPKQTLPLAFLSGLLLVTYTITGFDASAHTSEETHDAAKNVPRGIIGSVFWSAVFGYVMVCTFVLVMPDLTAAMKQGTGFFEAILAPIPKALRVCLELAMFFINYVCGLAAIMSTSRMVYAFARDGRAAGVEAAAQRESQPSDARPRDLDVRGARDRRHAVRRRVLGVERGQRRVPVHLVCDADRLRDARRRAHVDRKRPVPARHLVEAVRAARAGGRLRAGLRRHPAAEREGALRAGCVRGRADGDLVRLRGAQVVRGAAGPQGHAQRRAHSRTRGERRCVGVKRHRLAPRLTTQKSGSHIHGEPDFFTSLRTGRSSTA
ncbi:hypothetical protein ABID76_004627 [Burkholderia ambifaria]